LAFAAPSFAQPALAHPSFAPVIKRVSPAVVNIGVGGPAGPPPPPVLVQPGGRPVEGPAPGRAACSRFQ
jgi:S1-C subfamily serine protease